MKHTDHDIHWPGTTIVKSRGNAFDWRANVSHTLKDIKDSERKAQAGKIGGERTAPIYYGQPGGGSY